MREKNTHAQRGQECTNGPMACHDAFTFVKKPAQRGLSADNPLRRRFCQKVIAEPGNAVLSFDLKKT